MSNLVSSIVKNSDERPSGPAGKALQQAGVHVKRPPVVHRKLPHRSAQVRFEMGQPFFRTEFALENKFHRPRERGLGEQERVSQVRFGHFKQSGVECKRHAVHKNPWKRGARSF